MAIMPAGRRYDIDALRVFSFGTVIIYHTSLLFGSKGIGQPSDQLCRLMDLIAIGSHPWRMSLLFFISGLVTASLLTKKSVEEIRRSRTRQLLLPFLFGVVMVVPPQIYFANRYVNPDLSYWEFLKSYMQSGLTLEHMWFLAYLWIYVFVWSVTFSRFQRHWGKISSAFVSSLTGTKLFLVPVAFLSALRVFLYPVFGETLVITSDVYAHVMYFSMFMAGALLCNESRFWQEIDRRRWVSLWLSVISFLAIAILAMTLPRGQWSDLLVVAARVVRSILQWTAILALLAFTGRMVRGPNRIVTYLNKSIMTYYVMHQTIIIIAAYYFAKLGMLSVWSFFPIVIITVVVCFLVAEAKKLVSVYFTAFILKLSVLRKAAPKPPSPEAAG